ncbi:Ig-like domain-containing protein [Chryseobacterium sp. JAH]|uniref:Ig-like domain-containing protein n=1 Tax=Chryseobacterium sp. JAH TaxID=1742858 RepID=UPI0009E6ACE2|nr:Ig-like domain-containing protein [Chryseobacterium sp. JAH]
MKRILLLLLVSFLVHSCARMGSPVGGPKDTLAPKFLSSNIDTTRVNVRRDIKELRIDFDEYITLKDVNKNLNISPPIENITRILPSNIANKYLIIQWSDTLQANTTYNFNFGNSIADNSESNVLRYFNFAFSTGEKLDDLYISGEVKDAFTIMKQSSSENKMVVGLYQLKDTINYKQKPYYITKVDDDGYYELNYLAPGKFKIIAFDDENGNSIYDPGKEKIGFQKDTVTIEKSISGLNLKLYPSKKPYKKPELKEIPGGILMTFEGNPNDVKIISKNEKLQDFKVTHTPQSDSLRIWFDAVKNNLGQTVTENVKLGYEVDGKKDSTSVFYKYNTKNAMDINSDNGGNMLPPKTDFKITSTYIIDKISPEKWVLKSDSLTTQNFTAKISETNPYQILISSDFIAGKKYQLTIPKETVSSFYTKNVQSKRFDFEADKIENYGNLTFKILNAPSSKYWIQMLDTSENAVYQQYVSGSEVKFDIVKPGEYIARVLVDNNGNKRWDEADFVNQTFAEDSYIYYKMVVARPLWETREDWDLNDKRVFEGIKVAKPKSSNEKKDTELDSGLLNSNSSDLNSTSGSDNTPSRFKRQ